MLDRGDTVAVIVGVDGMSHWEHLGRIGAVSWATAIALVSEAVLDGAHFDCEMSERDIRMLQALADAKTMTEIAREEHVSYSTVRRMVRDLLAGLGADRVHAAIAKASSLGLIGTGNDRTGDATASVRQASSSLGGSV